MDLAFSPVQGFGLLFCTVKSAIATVVRKLTIRQRHVPALYTTFLAVVLAIYAVVAAVDQAQAASPGCNAFNSDGAAGYNQSGAITGTQFSYSQGFFAGDKLTVTKHSVGSNQDTYDVRDTTGSALPTISGPNTASTTFTQTTSDTILLRIIVFEQSGTFYTWSCTAGANPPTTPQTINFTSSPTSTNAGTSYTPSASGGGSGQPVTFTIDGSTTNNACTISGSTVHFNNVGTCVVDANQAGGIANGTVYTAASQAQQSVSVTAAKQNQTITFLSSAPAATVNGPTYSVDASSSSGLPVSFAIAASSASVCTISAGVVSFQAVGSCVINASQAGNATYNSTTAQQTVTVTKHSQTINFTSTAPSATPGGPTYTPSATAFPSGLQVAFTIDGSSASVCSIAGGAVSFQTPGSCVIDANQAGDGTYSAAPQVQQTVTVAKLNQTISFMSAPPAAAAVNGPTYSPSATASSGLAVVFTIDGSSASVCSISGGSVSFQTSGSCVIDANQAGNATYNAAPLVQQTVTVGKGTQTIAFSSTAPAAVVSGPTYTPAATASPSGLPVAFTIDASSASICSISGGAVSFLASGSCVIDANQSGNANYNAASQVQQTVTVGKGTQTIAFSSAAPAATVSGPTYTPAATASPSGLPVAFTIDASSASICSISGGAVSFLASGSCVIDADQSGSANYNAASQVRQTVTVGKGTQTIAFSSTAPAAAVSGPTYTPAATASPSGLPVAFTIDPSSASICSISGGAVSFLASGSCVIDANQAGSANYTAAAQVQQTVTVGKGTQTIAFSSTAPAAVVNGPTYTPAASASPSGLTVAFTIDASSASVCSIAAGTVSFLASGSCVIDANQSGSANYNAASQVQQTVTVGKGTQTIAFTSTAPAATVSGPTYTPSATATPSGLPVAFTIDGSSASICTISGGTVSFQMSGSCVIDANQSGSANYNAASQVQQTVTVSKGTQTIAFTSNPPVASVGGPTYTPAATASPSGLPVTFTVDGTSSAVCSIAAGSVSFQGPGTCVIDANQAGSTNYLAATQKQQSFVVNKASPAIAVQSSSTSIVFGAPVTFTATVSGGATPSGTVTFKDGAATLATVALSGGKATYTTSSLKTGNHSITAIYNGDGKNSAVTSAAVSVTISVRPNPALNPDVAGLVSAQASTAVMFGRAQLSNTQRRLEELHDEDDEDPATHDQPVAPAPRLLGQGQGAPVNTAANDPAGQKMSGTAAAAYALASPYGTLPRNADGLNPGFGRDPSTLSPGDALAYSDAPGSFSPRRDTINQTGRALAALSSIMPASIQALNKRADLPFHVWFAGALSFGSLNTDGSYSNHFNAAGMTLGFDRKFFDGFTAGVAFGVGLNHTDVGTDGTALDARAFTGTLYATYRIMPHTFVDAIAGYGKISSTDSRWSSDAATMLSGSRGGKDIYGSLGVSRDIRTGPWKVAPYLRLDVVHIGLDAYSETGSPIWDLTYNQLSSTDAFAVIGSRLGYTIPENWGTLTPTLRLEYSRALTGSYNQILSYTSLPGTNYLLTGTADVTDLMTVGVGVRAATIEDFTLGLEYLYSASPHKFDSQQLRANLKQAF